jgi:extradiol dioxygenase family protein
MFKKIAFTYYPVSEVARARKFYEKTLGLKAGSAGNQGDNWWVEYDLPGGGCLALTNFTKEKPSDTAGGTIAFEVEDLMIIGAIEVRPHARSEKAKELAQGHG